MGKVSAHGGYAAQGRDELPSFEQMDSDHGGDTTGEGRRAEVEGETARGKEAQPG